jgi:hypothetical protein
MTLMFAAVAGAAAANIYYNQPIVSLIARGFTVPGVAAALVLLAWLMVHFYGLRPQKNFVAE